MKEEMVFDVKTNIKSATQDTKKYTKSLSEAKEEQKNLNEQLSIQKKVITDLEKNLVLMEAKLKKTPRTGAAGFYALQEAIEKANDELNLEKIGLKEIKNEIDDNKQSVKGLEGVTKTATGGFKKMTTGVKSLGLALKAAGIGLVIAAFVALKEALSKNQDAVDIYDTTIKTISITFNQVVDALIDVYTWVTASSDRFNALGKVIDNLKIMALTPFIGGWELIKLAIQSATLAWEESFFGGKDADKITELKDKIKVTTQKILEIGDASLRAGKKIWDNAGEAMTEIGDIYDEVAKNIKKISIKGNYELAASIVEANKSAKKAEERIKGLIETNERLAELQRQIRDDDSKTFAIRIAANQKLREILKDQEKDMLELADAKVRAAALELEANTENLDLEIAHKKAINERAKIKADMTNMVSESLKKENKLQKQLLKAQREVSIEGLSGIKRELAELDIAYEIKLEMARKSGSDITALTKQYEKQKSDIIREGINDQLKAYSSLATALSGLAGENKALAVGAAIIDTYVGANKALAQGGALGFISAAAVIASGLANVKKILETDVGAGSGGSTPNIDAGTPAPQMMGGGVLQLGNVQETQPIQAYVVTDELTDNQNKLAYIRRRATI